MNKISLDYKEVSIVIKDFIKTYVKNSGLKGVVIGLSGGIDSAVTAVLCKDIFKKENLRCVFLPDDATPNIDRKHVDLIVKKFDLKCKKIEISNLIEETRKCCVIKPDETALGNIKARVRMIILYEYANVKKSIICGTSNKSEILVGYYTKYGDGGVDIMPIGDLYKTQIYELARYLKIPDEIIKKPPTAGLIKGQTDEKELKLSYDSIDIILQGLENKIQIKSIAKNANVKESEVLRIKNMRINSQHKRRLPMIPKLGTRTPGYDWRVPTQLG